MSKKILIVDDEHDVQKILGDKIKSEGFEVESAFDGEDALKKVNKEKPDLILLDIIMPRMDGISFLHELKKDPELDAIPVIMLTNLSSKEKVQESVEAGVRDYLVKAHYTLGEVIKKVKERI